MSGQGKNKIKKSVLIRMILFLSLCADISQHCELLYPLFYRNWCKAGIVYLQDLWVNGDIMRYEQIEQTVGTNGRLLFEYNALVNAIPESWKTRMDSNYQAMIILQEINTEIGPLSNLTNKKIRNVFDKLKNHDICAANFWRKKK